MTKISCIIPAYNEATRISNVLGALKEHPLVDEIIVVDDCSTDDTSEHVRLLHETVRLIVHESNKGKSAAVATGIHSAKNDLIMLIDGDLFGLTAHDITMIAQPVLDGRADITISLRQNSLFLYRLIGLDFVSGERVFHRSLLEEHLPAMSRLPGFGLEVFMNRQIIAQKLRISVVRWRKVISPRKWEKVGLFAGSAADITMIRQILRVISPLELIVQHVRLLALIVRRA